MGLGWLNKSAWTKCWHQNHYGTLKSTKLYQKQQNQPNMLFWAEKLSNLCCKCMLQFLFTAFIDSDAWCQFTNYLFTYQNHSELINFFKVGKIPKKMECLKCALGLNLEPGCQWLIRNWKGLKCRNRGCGPRDRKDTDTALSGPLLNCISKHRPFLSDFFVFKFREWGKIAIQNTFMYNVHSTLGLSIKIKFSNFALSPQFLVY